MFRKKKLSTLDALLEKEEKKQHTYHTQWKERKKAWQQKRAEIFDLFKDVENKVSKNKKALNHLYAISPTEQIVQLYFGNLPIGKKIDNDTHLETEKGAALVYSEGVDGSVLCWVFPCRSEQKAMPENYKIYKFYKSAAEIDAKQIEDALKFFLIYYRMSSAVFGTSWCERLSYKRINFKEKRIKKALGSTIKTVFSQAIKAAFSAF
jgi:hypothetical protein|nr:MAG TPA: hypothetical protein [Caudoviricetes sp.]